MNEMGFGIEKGGLIIPRKTLTLTASPVGAGTQTPNPTGAQFRWKSAVQVTATPGGEYAVANPLWTGDASGNDNPVAVTMNADKAVTANYVRQFWDVRGTGTQYAFCDHANTGADLDFGTADFTLEALVYFTSLTGNCSIIGKGDTVSQAGAWLLYASTTGHLLFFLKTASSYVQNTGVAGTITTDAWIHVAFVMVNHIGKFYKNGVLVGAGDTNYGTNTCNNTGVVNLGRAYKSTTPDAYLKGRIAQSRAWKGTARTAAQLADNRGSPWLAGPTLYHTFKPNTGDTFTPIVGSLNLTNGAAVGVDTDDLVRGGPYTIITGSIPS